MSSEIDEAPSCEMARGHLGSEYRQKRGVTERPSSGTLPHMEGGEVEATKGTVEEREVGGLGGAGHVLLAPRIFFSLQSLS